MISRFFLLLSLLFFYPAIAISGELILEVSKENVVSSRIEGTWEPHTDLSQRLVGKGIDLPSGVSFKSDVSILEKIPETYKKILINKNKKIYLAGHMTLQGKENPFIVTTHHGNPHILFWLEQDGNPFGNGESFNVMLTVAKDKKNDLLFIGGDFNNQPFLAFQRSDSK